jgi:hypothetical protein
VSLQGPTCRAAGRKQVSGVTTTPAAQQQSAASGARCHLFAAPQALALGHVAACCQLAHNNDLLQGSCVRVWETCAVLPPHLDQTGVLVTVLAAVTARNNHQRRLHAPLCAALLLSSSAPWHCTSSACWPPPIPGSRPLMFAATRCAVHHHSNPLMCAPAARP